MLQVRRAGLLHRHLGNYAGRIAAIATAFTGGWAAFVLLGDTWWQLVTAAFLAAVFAQLAFLGHDAGHQQVFRTRKANYLLGLIVGNLAAGLSIGWWVNNHNKHHANPNTEGADPDIMGILAHSSERARTGRGWRGFIFRNQAWLFFPMLTLEAGSLHGASVKAVVRRTIPNWRLEGGLLAVHMAGVVGMAFLVLSPGKALVFLAVQQGLFGLYMGCTFAPNHKGMEVLETPGSVDFLRRQVLTSRNVRGGWFTDAALGALNYQIEHHLFPSMPRSNLRHARPIVIAYCAELGVPYCETSLLESYGQALRHLHAVGREH
nr:acyl-CoA desaturase [Nocardia jejuensis]